MTPEELLAIGQQLRNVRLEREYSLQEVADSTRIRLHFLESIEEGHPDPSLSETQLRGFLRNYATFLHLDLDAMLFAYQQVVAQQPKRRLPFFGSNAQEPPPEVPVIPMRAESRVVKRTPTSPMPRVEATQDVTVVVGGPPSWVWIGLLVMIGIGLLGVTAVGGYFILNGLTTEEAASTSELISTGTPMDNQGESRSTAPLVIQTEETMPDSAAATPTTGASGIVVAPPEQIDMTGADRVSIAVNATQRSWVRVEVDGTVEYEGILRPGTGLQYQGDSSITFRTSNAGGVEVVVNNQELGSLGERGQLYEQTFALSELPGTGVNLLQASPPVSSADTPISETTAEEAAPVAGSEITVDAATPPPNLPTAIPTPAPLITSTPAQ